MIRSTVRIRFEALGKVSWKKILYVLPTHLDSTENIFWLSKPEIMRNVGMPASGNRRKAALSAHDGCPRHGPFHKVQDLGGVALGREQLAY